LPPTDFLQGAQKHPHPQKKNSGFSGSFVFDPQPHQAAKCKRPGKEAPGLGPIVFSNQINVSDRVNVPKKVNQRDCKDC